MTFWNVGRSLNFKRHSNNIFTTKRGRRLKLISNREYRIILRASRFNRVLKSIVIK